MPTRSSAVIAALALLMTAITFAQPPSTPPRPVPPLVLTFYYPWYGTPDGPGGKSRGGQLVHWERVDPAAKSIGSSTNYPVGGIYDSHDPVLIERHARLAKSTGIDVLISSWWGKGTFEDQALQSILDACGKAGVHACAYYEEVAKPGTPESVAAELTDLIKRYGDHPAYFSITRAGVRHPVIFVYSRAIQQLGVDKWKSVQQILAAAPGPRPLLIGDDFGARAVDIFDGAHCYGPAGDTAAAIRKGETAETWTKRAVRWWANCGEGGASARKAGKISCVTVFPGYDDTKVRKPGTVVSRNDGKFYETMWREAIEAKPDWVLITSFNEWHEGSEIEPSEELGEKYIKLTKQWASKFKQPTPSTP